MAVVDTKKKSKSGSTTGKAVDSKTASATGKTKSSILQSKTAGKAGTATTKQSGSKNGTVNGAEKKERPVQSQPTSLLTAAEVDFPRGAAPRSAGERTAPKPLVSQDKGLFNDGLQLADTPKAERKEKRKKPEGSEEAVKKRRISSLSKTDRSASKKGKTTKGASAATALKTAEKQDTFRVEHLFYKRLLPGPTVVLAQIIHILPLELIVSLPNQLLGHIPITNISKAFTQRLEADVEQSDDDDDEEEDDDDKDDSQDGNENPSSRKLPNLQDMFQIGQYLRTAVVKVLPSRTTAHNAALGSRQQRGTPDWKDSRRCELSLDPEMVNAGIRKDDLKSGQHSLQAYVKSVEDNGYVLDFGLNAASSNSKDVLTAFVTFKAEKKVKTSTASWPKHALTQGGVVTVRVLKLAEGERTASVSVQPGDVNRMTLTAAPNIASILPGTLVQATISAVTPAGLNLRFLNYFEGTVDSFHMVHGKAYKPQDKVKACILWTSPPASDSPVRFACSLLDHVVNFTTCKAPSLSSADMSEPVALSEAIPAGTMLDHVEIIRVEPEWGLLLSIPPPAPGLPPLAAWAHISHVSDDHIQNLQVATGSSKWKVGTVHPARVIGHSGLDGLIQVSLQPSVIARKFMRVNDLHVGDELEGTVQRLSDSALFVNIGGNVAGVVWPVHYSDIKLKHPERRFKAGAAIKARVFSLDEEKNRVSLTLKKTLLASNLPVLQNFADAKVGTVLHAVVQSFLPGDKDMLVELFGGLRAFVPVAEAADTFVESISKTYSVGQVVKVLLTKVDVDARRLTASIKQAADTYKAPQRTESSKKAIASIAEIADVSSVKLGSIVSGRIVEVHETQAILSLDNVPGKALLALAALAKAQQSTVEAVRSTLSSGDEMSNLLVVTKNEEKGILILAPNARPKSLLLPGKTGISANGARSLSFESLTVGDIVEGVINDQTAQGYLVQLSRGIRGKISWTELADDYDEVSQMMLSTGAPIRCKIIQLDAMAKRIELSARKTQLDDGDDAPRDPRIDSVTDLSAASPVRGFVRSISDAGLFLELGRDVVVRVQIRELFDEYVKDWKSRFAVGQLVDGKILSVDKDKKKAEMSLRKTSSTKRSAVDSPTVVFEGLHEGKVVKGTVKRIENYGVFIRIQGSNISGLCHKSELAEDKVDDPAKVIQMGASVKAVILSLDSEKQKIAFSIKPSRLAEASAESDEEDEDTDDDANVMRRLSKLVEMERGAASDNEEVSENDSDDDDIEFTLGQANDTDNAEEADFQETPTHSGNSAIVDEVSSAKPNKAPLTLSAFRWDGEYTEVRPMDEVIDDEASESESGTPDSDHDENKRVPKDGILINDRTGDLATKAPTTPGDFERMLMGSPNSSHLWVQFMSYYVQSSDLEQARAVGQKALRTINFREEDEKMNVWMAIISLENALGTQDTFEATFNKAIQANDDKQIYLRTVQVLEQAEDFEKTEQLFERLVKRFNTSSKCWTAYGQFLLNRDRKTDARELLPRALKSLPKRKHIKTITQYAIMEFKAGEPERGRTVFEGIVDTYPKRLDLWWIYIDQEIRLKNTVGVRALFERVMLQKLSSKKTKSLLKKWLAFEKQFGDADGEQSVKDRAVAYVQTLRENA